MTRKRTIQTLVTALLVSALAGPAAAGDEGLDADSLGRMIETFVRNRADGAVREISIPTLEHLALAEAVDYDVALSTHPSQQMAGWVPLTVSVSSGGETLRRGVVTVRVDAERQAVVTSRPLRRGAVIRDQDLLVDPRSVDALPEGWLADPEPVVGKRLRRSLAAGAPLSSEHVEEVPAVRRGQRVKLELRHGSLRIEGFGRAQQDGHPGEWIRVRNLTSKRELTGRVAKNGVVHVEL